MENDSHVDILWLIIFYILVRLVSSCQLDKNGRGGRDNFHFVEWLTNAGKLESVVAKGYSNHVKQNVRTYLGMPTSVRLPG